MNLKRRFIEKNDSFRIECNKPNLQDIVCSKITSWLPEYPREYVAVCIGTDRSTGDSLGPFSGTFLTELKPRHITVYGTLDEPVHAANLANYIQLIERNHHNPFIIAIDACLGKSTSVGSLITGTGPIKPGAALNKVLEPVGNIHITGVVNVSGFMEYSILQNTRLSIVVDMARKIARILNRLDEQLQYSRSSPAVPILNLSKQSTIDM